MICKQPFETEAQLHRSYWRGLRAEHRPPTVPNGSNHARPPPFRWSLIVESRHECECPFAVHEKAYRGLDGWEQVHALNRMDGRMEIRVELFFPLRSIARGFGVFLPVLLSFHLSLSVSPTIKQTFSLGCHTRQIVLHECFTMLSCSFLPYLLVPGLLVYADAE
jgi:hypothetical protein